MDQKDRNGKTLRNISCYSDVFLLLKVQICLGDELSFKYFHEKGLKVLNIYSSEFSLCKIDGKVLTGI